jgi:HK97 family phage major capsid protein
MATLTQEQLSAMLDEKISGALGTVTKGLTERLDALEKPATPVHTKGHIQDDGTLQEVNEGVYRLPGGSEINTGRMWGVTGKGMGSGALLRKSTGVFEKLGEETQEYFAKMREKLRDTDTFKTATKGYYETKALDIGDVIRSQDDKSGGLFVPDDIRYSLLQFAPPGTIVWPRAQIWPMTTQTIQWPKLKQDLTDGEEEFFGNVVMHWTEEGREKTATKAEFGQVGLTCHELSAYTEITDILIEDSAINIGNLLVQLFQGTYWHFTDRSFLRGMGNIQPLGVLNDPKTRSVKRYQDGVLRYEDLLNMSTELPPMFDAGACFFMGKGTFNSLRKQKDDDGRPVIQLGDGYNNFGEGIAGYILGYPVVMADYKVNKLGLRGDVVLADWKHYFIGERSGVKMEMSRHTAFEYNRTAFRASARLGGIPEEANAFVILSDEVSDESEES